MEIFFFDGKAETFFNKRKREELNHEQVNSMVKTDKKSIFKI